MATFTYTKESSPNQNPVDAVAGPIAFVGWVVLIAVAVVIAAVFMKKRSK